MSLPTKGACLENLRGNFAHSYSVEYYLEQLAETPEFSEIFSSFPDDPQRPHDFKGGGHKGLLPVILGKAAMDMANRGELQGADVETAKQMFEESISLHNEQAHHKVNGRIGELPEAEQDYQLLVWAVDAYCANREARPYHKAVTHSELPGKIEGTERQLEMFGRVHEAIGRVNRRYGEPPALNYRGTLEQLLSISPERAGVRLETYRLLTLAVGDAIDAINAYFSSLPAGGSPQGGGLEEPQI